MSKNKARKRLSNFDFTSEDSHVALVDKGANERSILVMKALEPKEQEDLGKEQSQIEKNAEPVGTAEEPIRKDESMKVEDPKSEDLTKAETPVITEDSKEIEKKADETKVEVVEKSAEQIAMEKELEELRKAKTQVEADKAELEELRKAKEAKEHEEFVNKAKELKTDDADVFAKTLKKCKYALEEEEYETLVKQLEKLKNIEDNKDLLKSVGDADAETIVKSVEERQEEFYNELIEKGVYPLDASKQAREKFKSLKEEGK